MKSDQYLDNLLDNLHPPSVQFDLRTSENFFTGWLMAETETESLNEWNSFSLPESEARVVFQRARASQEFPPHPQNPSFAGMFLVIDGYMFADKDEGCTEPTGKFPIIVFELLPLRQDQTKVKVCCLRTGNLAIVFYYYHLLQEIGTLWLEAKGAQRAVEEFWNSIGETDNHFSWTEKDAHTATASVGSGQAESGKLGYMQTKILEAYQDLLADDLTPTDELIAARLPVGRKGQKPTRETVNRYRVKMRKRGIDV